MRHATRQAAWPALAIILWAGCRAPAERDYVPAPAEAGAARVVAMGEIKLLEEPGGSRRATLQPGDTARVLERRADEQGFQWLLVEKDVRRGWLPEGLARPVQGEEGRIATH